MAARGFRSIEVTGQAQRRYNAEIQAAMHDTVWQANCNNYYRHPSGKIVTQLPFSGLTFAKRTRQLNLGDYRLGR